MSASIDLPVLLITNIPCRCKRSVNFFHKNYPQHVILVQTDHFGLVTYHFEKTACPSLYSNFLKMAKLSIAQTIRHFFKSRNNCHRTNGA